MIARWSAPALLGAVAAALLLTPTPACAEIFFIPFGNNRPYTFGGTPYYYGSYQRPYSYSYTNPSYSWSMQTYSTYILPASNPTYQPRTVSPGYEPEYPNGNMSRLGASGPVALAGWASRAVANPRMRSTLAPALPVALVTPSEVAATTAHIQVDVPTADAVVLFQGAKTAQTGTTREFMSPPLNPGSYTYTVEARWSAQGQPRTAKRTVTVRPGTHVLVDFTGP